MPRSWGGWAGSYSALRESYPSASEIERERGPRLYAIERENLTRADVRQERAEWRRHLFREVWSLKESGGKP